MDLGAIQSKIDELEARRRQWSAPIDAVIQANLSRVNRDGYTVQDFKKEIHQIREQQNARAAVYEDIDEFLDSLCSDYLHCTTDEAHDVRMLFVHRRGLQNSLLGYVYRAARHIHSPGDVHWLRLGIAAVSMENFAVDYRDSLLALAEIYVAAERAGIDPQPVLNDISGRSGRELPTGGMTPTAEALVKFPTYAVLAERRAKFSLH